VPRPRDEGSVLVADVALAAVVLIVVAATTSAVGVLADARQRVDEAARSAAIVAARSGDLSDATVVARSLAPDGAAITITRAGGAVTATVSVRVRLPHPVLRWVSLGVAASVVQQVAPYRSSSP
jgi:Flp pilus assembly protein TadG